MAAAVHANASQNATAAISAASATTDQSESGVVKGKNVCVVEPQSTSKATAVVAPLMAGETRQFTELFGEPIVKPDVPKKHQHMVC